jgi:enamine deaminase RidA (YjgF/YER057c/UK114 family)
MTLECINPKDLPTPRLVTGDHKPADVVLGVATLSPDYLIEVDAIAIID